MADIGQQALLGGKERLQPFQRLVEGADKIPDLVVLRSLIRNAAGEVIRTVDLLNSFGYGAQRLERLPEGKPDHDPGEQYSHDPNDRKHVCQILAGSVYHLEARSDLQHCDDRFILLQRAT